MPSSTEPFVQPPPGAGALEQRLRPLLAAIAELSPHWEWDGWFATPMTLIEPAAQAQFDSALRACLPCVWEHADTHANRAGVGEVSRVLGGLEQGQRLYTTVLDVSPVVVVAWWPWGREARVSLRVGLYLQGLRPDLLAWCQGQLRPWFGL